MIASDLDAIPLPRWLLWNTETRKGRATKMPHQIDGITASSTDAPKWFEFWPVTKGRRPDLFNGIGVVSGDAPDGPHLGGIDVDSCVDDQGRLAPWAQSIAAALPTHIEISHTGTGLKAFFCCRAGAADEPRVAFGITPPQWGCKRSVGNRAFAHWLAERPDPADLATQIDASTSLLGELAYLMLQAEGVP